MSNKKYFPKIISQWEFDYGLFTNLPTFFRVHSNLKEVSYLSWQNTYPNLKTTCHIKLKFFLWTYLKNLLLAKYLIAAAAPLMLCYTDNVMQMCNVIQIRLFVSIKIDLKGNKREQFSGWRSISSSEIFKKT